MSSHGSDESKGHEHHHHHDPEHMKAIVNRLSKAIGHLESVKKMVEDDRDCAEVLVQLAAVRSAINNCGKEILKEHMSHCIVHAVQDGDLPQLQGGGSLPSQKGRHVHRGLCG